jgi:hypothetical protein
LSTGISAIQGIFQVSSKSKILIKSILTPFFSSASTGFLQSQNSSFEVFQIIATLFSQSNIAAIAAIFLDFHQGQILQTHQLASSPFQTISGTQIQTISVFNQPGTINLIFSIFFFINYKLHLYPFFRIIKILLTYYPIH